MYFVVVLSNPSKPIKIWSHEEQKKTNTHKSKPNKASIDYM